MYKVLPKNSRHLNVAREPVLVRTIGAWYRCIYPFLNQCATWLRAECTHSFDLRLCITSCLCRTHIYQTTQRHIPEHVSVSSFSKLFIYLKRDSVVGIVTCYGLDGPGFRSRQAQEIFFLSQNVKRGSDSHPASY